MSTCSPSASPRRSAPSATGSTLVGGCSQDGRCRGRTLRCAAPSWLCPAHTWAALLPPAPAVRIQPISEAPKQLLEAALRFGPAPVQVQMALVSPSIPADTRATLQALLGELAGRSGRFRPLLEQREALEAQLDAGAIDTAVWSLQRYRMGGDALQLLSEQEMAAAQWLFDFTMREESARDLRQRNRQGELRCLLQAGGAGRRAADAMHACPTRVAALPALLPLLNACALTLLPPVQAPPWPQQPSQSCELELRDSRKAGAGRPGQRPGRRQGGWPSRRRLQHALSATGQFVLQPPPWPGECAAHPADSGWQCISGLLPSLFLFGISCV